MGAGGVCAGAIALPTWTSDRGCVPAAMGAQAGAGRAGAKGGSERGQRGEPKGGCPMSHFVTSAAHGALMGGPREGRAKRAKGAGSDVVSEAHEGPLGGSHVRRGIVDLAGQAKGTLPRAGPAQRVAVSQSPPTTVMCAQALSAEAIPARQPVRNEEDVSWDTVGEAERRVARKKSGWPMVAVTCEPEPGASQGAGCTGRAGAEQTASCKGRKGGSGVSHNSAQLHPDNNGTQCPGARVPRPWTNGDS
jgi:hypothetical protein